MNVVLEECVDAGAERLDDGLVGRWLEHRNDVAALEALISRGFVVDTMEVAARWRDLPKMYAEATHAIQAVDGTLAASAHLSHSYLDGACLYFTFAGQIEPDGREAYYRAAWDAGRRGGSGPPRPVGRRPRSKPPAPRSTPPAPSTPSASPTSAARPSSGTAPRASRSGPRWAGRTCARSDAASSCAAKTSGWRRTRRRPSSSGCSTRSTRSGVAACASAPSTPGRRGPCPSGRCT